MHTYTHTHTHKHTLVTTAHTHLQPIIHLLIAIELLLHKFQSRHITIICQSLLIRYPVLTDIILLFTFPEIFYYSWYELAAVSRLLYLYSSKVTADPPYGRRNL